jgi:predicted secreted protein
MKGNATTGYDWVVVSMPEGLKLVKDWYQSDSADEHIVGAGGTHYFTFSGEKGTYDVVLDYQRSWVGSEGNTVTVQVTIQ